MKTNRPTKLVHLRARAFTLTEVVMSMGLAGVMIGGIVSGFVQSSKQAEWASYSLAANSLAMQGLEQVRAAKWDPRGYPAVDQVIAANFPLRTNILDIPISGTNIVFATNRTTISTISTAPPLKMIRVDTTWRFFNRRVYTNSVFTYRAPDQ